MPITISRKDNKLNVSGTFLTKTSDYKNDIPKIVSNKISFKFRIS